MSGRPALIRQRDAKQIIAAAKKAGAPRVELTLPGGTAVVIHLNEEKEKPKDKRGRPGSIADAVKRDLEANGSY
jgi:hypothetical protein